MRLQYEVVNVGFVSDLVSGCCPLLQRFVASSHQGWAATVRRGCERRRACPPGLCVAEVAPRCRQSGAGGVVINAMLPRPQCLKAQRERKQLQSRPRLRTTRRTTRRTNRTARTNWANETHWPTGERAERANLAAGEGKTRAKFWRWNGGRWRGGSRGGGGSWTNGANLTTGTNRTTRTTWTTWSTRVARVARVGRTTCTGPTGPTRPRTSGRPYSQKQTTFTVTARDRCPVSLFPRCQ